MALSCGLVVLCCVLASGPRSHGQGVGVSFGEIHLPLGPTLTQSTSGENACHWTAKMAS